MPKRITKFESECRYGYLDGDRLILNGHATYKHDILRGGDVAQLVIKGSYTLYHVDDKIFLLYKRNGQVGIEAGDIRTAMKFHEGRSYAQSIEHSPTGVDYLQVATANDVLGDGTKARMSNGETWFINNMVRYEVYGVDAEPTDVERPDMKPGYEVLQ